MCNFAWLFRILLAVSLLVPVANATAQTSPAPPQASPSIAPSRDVTGRWDFRMDTGPDRIARGELWLFPRGEEFTGTATVQGRNALPVRMLTVRGERIAMTVDTPEGPVTFDGTLHANGQSLQGTLIYHHGEEFPFSADKRAPTP
jgi:hypothetical protein